MPAAAPQAPDVPPRRRRARLAAAAALLLVTSAITVAVVVSDTSGHRPLARPRAAAGAATVRRRNLVTSTVQTGRISYSGRATVADGLVGTITWAPRVGRVIEPGQRLFDVDDFPVLLMDGTVPAYRELRSGDSPGPDIAQLNADLVALGFDDGGIIADDEWQPATTAGVQALQQADGEPVTGSLLLGDVVFLRGAQRVAALQGGAAQVSDSHPSSAGSEFVSDTVPTGGSDRAVSRLRQEIGRLRSRNRALAHQAAAARASANAEPRSGGDIAVMTTTSTNLVVTAKLPAGEQSVTRIGARVPVQLPSGATVHGHVVGIGAAASGGGSSVPITIHLDRHEDGRDLDQASVSVTFVQRVARHVLSVPVTALLARPGGRYALQQAPPPHALIDVHLGTFATGFVQVSGRGLRSGLKVTDSQG